MSNAKQTANTTTTGSRASRASQNELTLPPIVEAQVSNIQNNNNNTQNKKSNSNIRVDSGIIHDYNSENGGAGWTLSPQGSDNGVDKSNTPNSGANYKHTVITTVEIVENPNSLKKNATSSTLNSYGKSSSIQSKLTTATTNSSNNKKFNLSATSTSSSAANKPNAQAGHLTAIASEQDYIESIAKLHSIPDFSENNNLFKNKAGSVNNLAKQEDHNEDYVNSHYYSNVSNGNGSNYYSVNGSTKPLERSLTTYNINNRGGANLNHFSNNFQANQSSRNKSPFRNKEFSDKFNNSNTNLNTSFNTPRAKPQQQNLPRQNTTLTDIKDFSPLVTRRNSNLANNSQTQIGKNSMNGQQQQQPVPKPRRVEKRTNSLQRQSTFIPVNSNIDNSFMSQNTSRQPAQQQPQQQPQRQDNRSKFTINTNPVNPNEKSNENRPKTGLNRQANKNSNNTLINQSVNNNMNSNNTLVKLNSVNNNNSIDLVQAKVAPAETSTSKNNNNNTANTSDNQNSNELNNLNLIPLETLTGINNDTGLNDYTVMRILKWLEDVESCANKIKPPSQLTWSNNNNNAKFERHHSNDMGRNFNNEYYLSDYDSADDQIIEYNRIVDKTFHIVHDED